MKYKFFGTPDMLVRERTLNKMTHEWMNKPIFRFDEKGEYVTDNQRLIQKLMHKFDHTPINEEENKSYQCKKCDYTTENKGELMAHYREKHPKEGK